MDDVDAVNGQIARNMLTSGDWVTARLDGVIDLEKPPLIYWLIAGSYKIFGVHDWSARIPVGSVCDWAGLVDVRFRHLGIREESRFLCRLMHGDLCGNLFVHKNSDFRCDADVHDCFGNVGIFARH